MLGLKAKVAKLVFRGETLNGIDADLSVQGNLLKVNGLKVAELLGAKFDLKGQVADFGTAPRFDVTFNATMPDTDKLLVYAGMPKFLNGKLGASTAGGSVTGTMDALTLRNASVTLAGATARATGSLVLGDKFAFDLSNFSVQTQDASRLVSVATGRAQAGLGGLVAEGAFKGNDQRAVVRRQPDGHGHADGGARSTRPWASGPTSPPSCVFPARSTSTTGWVSAKRPRHVRPHTGDSGRSGRCECGGGAAADQGSARGDRQADRPVRACAPSMPR